MDTAAIFRTAIFCLGLCFGLILAQHMPAIDLRTQMLPIELAAIGLSFLLMLYTDRRIKFVGLSLLVIAALA